MYKKCLIGIIIMQSLICTCAQLQDHVILWDASNWRFKEGQNEIYVNEGDNLIFICPPNRTFSQSLYWTNDSRVTIKCNRTLSIKVIKLLDCFGDNYATEFILKISKFHEISSLPVFHHELPIHFVAQSVICQNSNFRLSVRLASTHKTSSTDSVSNGSAIYIKKSNLTNHYEKSTTSNKSSYFHIKRKIAKFISNVSSTSHLNYEFTNSEQTTWKEYRFLILPATLAFFTLIGMQIVFCSFWLPISVINKFFKHFRPSKHLHKLKSQSNQKVKQNESNSLKVCKENSKIPNQSLCWGIPTQTSMNSCATHSMKESISNYNQFITSYNQLNDYKLINQNYQTDFHSQNYQFQLVIPQKSLKDNHDDYFNQINSKILCNCSYHQHQIIMELNEKQTNILPIFISSNMKLHGSYTTTQTISELIQK
uniref:Ephrin RBD domain-containing protein n=1 Tax=Schistosoma mansoni TaxID=6183 RepID=A0A3Q0KM31_SCHMA